MKAVAGTILILAAATILAPHIQHDTDLWRAALFAIPPGVVGLIVLIWGLFQTEQNIED